KSVATPKTTAPAHHAGRKRRCRSRAVPIRVSMTRPSRCRYDSHETSGPVSRHVTFVEAERATYPGLVRRCRIAPQLTATDVGASPESVAMHKIAFHRCASLTGPSASGKTAVGVALAQRLGAEIIALDSMTIYRGMNIGTAKPPLT